MFAKDAVFYATRLPFVHEVSAAPSSIRPHASHEAFQQLGRDVLLACGTEDEEDEQERNCDVRVLDFAFSAFADGGFGALLLGEEDDGDGVDVRVFYNDAARGAAGPTMQVLQQIAQLHPVRRRMSGQGGDAVGCAARESTTCSVLLVASEIEARRRGEEDR